MAAATGWDYETSGAVERFVTQPTYVECHAGGVAASTHYARIRRKLPERDNFAPAGRFSVEGTFSLPADFYDQHQSYMRLLTTDNFPGTYQSGGSVGAATADEWRVGFTIYQSDQRFRLISEHENRGTIVLWAAPDRLPAGLHTVKINFAPSTGLTGAWEVHVDGVKVASGSNVQTVPVSVQPAEMVVTRASGCIDGAAAQDTRPVQVDMHSIRFRAETGG